MRVAQPWARCKNSTHKPSSVLSGTGVTHTIEQALMQAYREEADALFRFALLRTRERERAVDVVQETYLRVWRYLSGGNTVEALRAILYKTARNIIIDEARKDVHRNAASLDAYLDEGGDVADESEPLPYDPMDLARAMALLAELEPPEYREAIHLRFIEELTPGEIAEVLGVSENVVSVRVNRGMKKLRAQFASTTT